ncbi:chloromuconate cycloisomerase [Roseovarius faecimaris]|uniref:glucarate dehydratase n=1 Tax=Roseovarius faecimaris TaxID=2494550 RepID=A0A6I6IVQ0_9RHOB|nr:mandelate racemase/muconate lactonizing enzyme family protein [Roseovarius faecimaris]QGX99711.1 chloromuconate cycloisomerase [Roseovarius faecimaris]
MKIRSISATAVNIPFVAPYRFSYGSIASLTKTVIQLRTEDGVVGLGECADGDRVRDVEVMGEALIGLDIRLIQDARRRVVPDMEYSAWANLPGLRRAFGGIEMAMWDARGKTEGVPLWHLLGGKARDHVALTEYFSFREPGPTHPGESTPLEIARFCAEMIEQHDARIFEGKLATVDLATEVEMVREIRAAIGDRELRLDANGGWTLPSARQAILALQPYDVAWYEEPVESYEEMAALRAMTPASFSAHRIDLRKAVALGAPDAIVTNLNELGGIANTVAFIAACERFDVGFRFHSGETGIASAAYLQVSAALEPVRGASQTLFRWYADDVIEGGPFVPKSGAVSVPDGPGLGVVLDSKALERCHQRYCDEGAFPAATKAGRYGGSFRKL